jgi:pyridoxal phosphate enzyme (YggS family)
MDIASNLNAVQEQISAACARAGRKPDTVTLLAVAKGQPPEAVRDAADAGLKLIGENRVQEAKAKIPLCPGNLHWHMIGHLQSNKARDAVELLDMIQSVDSLHLAQEISKWAERSGKTIPILLEVNIAGEASKFGYAPEALRVELEQINALPRIEIHGLMTIAPWTPDPERTRPVFRQLRDLKTLYEGVLGVPLPHLSMGMSGDFEVAIEEGATVIRLGSALFGPRPSAGKGAPTWKAQ